MKEGPISEAVYLTSGERNQPLWSGLMTFSLRKTCVDMHSRVGAVESDLV